MLTTHSTVGGPSLPARESDLRASNFSYNIRLLLFPLSLSLCSAHSPTHAHNAPNMGISVLFVYQTKVKDDKKKVTHSFLFLYLFHLSLSKSLTAPLFAPTPPPRHHPLTPYSVCTCDMVFICVCVVCIELSSLLRLLRGLLRRSVGVVVCKVVCVQNSTLFEGRPLAALRVVLLSRSHSLSLNPSLPSWGNFVQDVGIILLLYFGRTVYFPPWGQGI